MKTDILFQKQIINFFIYIPIQFFIVYVVDFTCYIYLAFIILMPLHKKYLNITLYICFGLGFVFDILYSAWGVYTATNVLTVYIKYYLIKYCFKAYLIRNPDINYLTIKNVNFILYFFFITALTIFHIFVLYCLEAKNFFIFFQKKTQISLDIIFTIIFILASQYLFHYKLRHQS